MRARILVFLAILATSTGFDQASKVWARDSLTPGKPETLIFGLWDWELAKNPGVAFSTPDDGNHTALHIGLGIVAAIALVGIGIAASRTRPEQRLRRTAYALLAGGALGNLIDRIIAGDVTDFVRWHINEHMWPVFNVADAALVIGVALLLVDGMRERKSSRPVVAA